ncbi:hypothetical protein [Luteolibacter soli]|uniref:DUF1772 domain-containing protein n=1 Tax=Luteolibacter soli TaxID=3135280 RepID=A0ABU9ASL6_9BACT
MPISSARRMNLIALAVLLTGLISFVAFHFLIFVDFRPDDDAIRGWQVWPEVWRFVRDPDFNQLEDLIATSALFTSVLLTVISPFAIPLFRSSRLAWWLAAIVSGAAMLGLTGVLLVNYVMEPSESEKPGAGFFCLVASQALNFVGLLFVRRENEPELIAGGPP